ncbi:hypothetical protein OBG91_15775 [Lactococcus lactis]|nr:hypothetical protein [Lactococcus lactis]
MLFENPARRAPGGGASRPNAEWVAHKLASIAEQNVQNGIAHEPADGGKSTRHGGKQSIPVASGFVGQRHGANPPRQLADVVSQEKRDAA